MKNPLKDLANRKICVTITLHQDLDNLAADALAGDQQFQATALAIRAWTASANAGEKMGCASCRSPIARGKVGFFGCLIPDPLPDNGSVIITPVCAACARSKTVKTRQDCYDLLRDCLQRDYGGNFQMLN